MRRTLAGNRYSLLIGERRLLHGHPFFILSAGCGRQEVECSEAAAITFPFCIVVCDSYEIGWNNCPNISLATPPRAGDTGPTCMAVTMHITLQLVMLHFAKQASQNMSRPGSQYIRSRLY